MRLEHRARYSIAGIALAIALGGALITRAQSGPPSDSAVAFAAEVSDLLLDELVAALFQEFNETTPQNMEHGKQAISLIFNDLNRDIRLVGTFKPLGGANFDTRRKLRTTRAQAGARRRDAHRRPAD